MKKKDYSLFVYWMRLGLYITVIQTLLLSSTIASIGNAQVKKLDEVMISLDLNQSTLQEALAIVEQTTDYKFAYDEKMLNKKRSITITGSGMTVKDALMEISKQANVSFQRVNNEIDVKSVRKGQEVQVIEVAADVEISGTVIDEFGEGLPGVTVLVKGTTSGTSTDLNGFYRLVAPEGSTLAFSYVGYINQEVVIGSQSVIDIQMEPDAAQLEEIVVVGYGEQKKVTVTGAVTAVKGKDLIKSPATDISNSLAGRLPGLVVIQTNGEPGNDGATITIRGNNTLGQSEPLIVIDGIPDRDGGLGRISPQDIESISVLKDASAAIYGARAANGAILITTKRGTVGSPEVTFDFNQGWGQPTITPEMSNAVEYATIMNELAIFNGLRTNPEEWDDAWQGFLSSDLYNPVGGGTIDAPFTQDAIRQHGDGSDPWAFPDTDWFGDAFKTWSPQRRYNLSLSGGSEDVKYYGSLGFVDQEAYYNNSATFYKQYSLRMNVDAKVNEYINTRFGVMLRREDRNFPTEDSEDIFRMLMRGRPTEPAVWPNGLPGPDIENGQNPIVITTNATGFIEQPTDYIQTNASVDITNPWVEGLKLTLSGALDRNTETEKNWQTPWMLYSWDRSSFEADGVTPALEGNIRSNFTDPRLTETYREIQNYNLTAMLNYTRDFGQGHSINLLAGVTKERFEGRNFFAFRRNFISSAVDQLFAGGAIDQNTGGLGFDRTRLGYYGRAQYNYNEKYLAEFIWRYDGSFIFPESDRFGFFPGLLLGWNVSNEEFFNVPFFDYLKLRASYGQMGNDRVAIRDNDGDGTLDPEEYAFLAAYGFGEYPINGAVANTLQETVLANPSFTWERANNYNIGVDATVWNGKIDFTLEYFINKRDQILIPQTGSTPATSGISALLPPVNAGKVDNKGFEYSVVYNGHGTDLRYSIGINGGYAKNQVVFIDEIPGAPDYQRQEGKSINGYLVYQSDGVFRDMEEIAANTIDYSGVTNQLLPGDMKFADLNNDGVINGDDQIRLDDNGTPTFNFGATFNLQWKGFDFSMLLQGARGSSLPIMTESGDIGNYLKYSFDNRWSIDNPSSEHPRLASRGDTYYTGGTFGSNTYFLFSKNYIRVKNIELGYTLPSTLVGEGKWIKSTRFYVNALNLLTFSEFDIFDPEVSRENGDGRVYPQSRVINVGFSLTF